jgi:hypothetical protein
MGSGIEDGTGIATGSERAVDDDFAWLRSKGGDDLGEQHGNVPGRIGRASPYLLARHAPPLPAGRQPPPAAGSKTPNRRVRALFGRQRRRNRLSTANRHGITDVVTITPAKAASRDPCRQRLINATRR